VNTEIVATNPGFPGRHNLAYNREVSEPIGSLTEPQDCQPEGCDRLPALAVLAVVLGAVVGVALNGIRFLGGFLFIFDQVVSLLIHNWPFSVCSLTFGLLLLASNFSRGFKRRHLLGLLPFLSNIVWMEWGSHWFCKGGGGDDSLPVMISHGFFVLTVILGLGALALQRGRHRVVVGLLLLEVPVGLACAFVVGMATSGTWL
jgi:hypothetical protein